MITTRYSIDLADYGRWCAGHLVLNGTYLQAYLKAKAGSLAAYVACQEKGVL